VMYLSFIPFFLAAKNSFLIGFKETASDGLV